LKKEYIFSNDRTIFRNTNNSNKKWHLLI
jgi:hypothetical protein